MRSVSTKRLRHGRRGGLDGAGVMFEQPSSAGMLDLAALFGNQHPTEVEIGTGKGTFLVARAAARPEVNFIGIEWARPYCLYAADRARRAGLANVRMICTDAGEFFRDCLPDRSLTRVHIYFPDPWPKCRHNVRRLIQPSFVQQARRTLRKGGQLLIVTDHLGYFQQICRVLSNAEGFALTDFPAMADDSGEIVGTNFERKYIACGRAFYRIAAMRIR